MLATIRSTYSLLVGFCILLAGYGFLGTLIGLTRTSPMATELDPRADVEPELELD